MTLKLHILIGCPYCTRVMLAFKAANIKHEVVIHTKLKGLKTDAYLALNPKGEAPVLETDQGTISGSIPIMRYIAKLNLSAGLYGSTDFEAAQIDQWMETVNSAVAPIGGCFVALVDKYGKGVNEVTYQAYKNKFIANMKSLDEHLSLRTYVFGHQVTLVDIVFVSHLAPAFATIFEVKTQNKLFKHVARYFRHLVSLPLWTKSFGTFFNCSKEFGKVPLVEEGEVTEEKKTDKKKGGKKNQKKEKKKKNTENKKADKKPKKAKKPETKFDLYAFKTMIVNAKDKQVAVKFLAENHDSKAFSCWYGRYQKLEKEGKSLMRTNNGAIGFIRDVNSFKKHLFGVWNVLGEEPELETGGIFYWHDPDFLPEMKAHSCSDYVEWKKLDLTKKEDFDLVVDYWTDTDKTHDLTLQTYNEIK